MEIKSVEGIILSETNYSESSKIINVLTKELGLIGIMSKGCRNLKSKLRAVSRKLVYGKFHIYYKEGKLSTLISVDLINSYSTILTDLEKLSYASLSLDLVTQVIKQNNDPEIYEVLKSTLSKMDEGFDSLILTSILEIRLLDFLGVKPNIDGCAICGNQKGIITLSSYSGGYICRDCYTNEGIVKEETIKMIRLLSLVDISKITKLDLDRSIIKEIMDFLDDYYDRYTGLYFKTKKFLNKIEKITIDN